MGTFIFKNPIDAISIKQNGTDISEIYVANNDIKLATDLEINRLFRTEYSITANITNGTIPVDSFIWSGETITIRVTPNSGYMVPETISVSGATCSYDRTTGVITLSEALSNVTIEGDCIYQIGFRGMSSSNRYLTRTGAAIGATWDVDSNGIISIKGIDLDKIVEGYVGNNGEALSWDGTNLKYIYNGNVYNNHVFIKLHRFFIKPIYSSNKLDGYSLYFGNIAPQGYEDWFWGKDHIVVGCYKGCGDLSSGIPSKQGCTTNKTVAKDFVDAYKLNSSTVYNLHEKWYNEDSILKILFMVLFATKQTEDVYPLATFRRPAFDGRPTGYLDSYRAQTLFAFEPTGNDECRGNMFLGIEDFIGGGLEVIGGVYMSGGKLYHTSNYDNFAYVGATPEMEMVQSSCKLPLTGYITELQQDSSTQGLLIPKTATTGDYSNSYFCDSVSIDQYGNIKSVYQGSNTGDSHAHGLFYFYAQADGDGGWYYANTAYQGRLCGIPK